MGKSIVSLDAELSVIGCILVDFESTMKTVCEILRPEHFADSILAETYALAYKRYCESARDLSIVTAVEHLKGDFPVSDCKERLAKAMEITVSTSVASEHANVVKNHYKARECQKLLTNALGSLPDTVHIDQNIEMIADKLGEIIREKEKNRLQSIREPIVDAYIGAYQAIGDDGRVDTGFSELDKYLDGIFPSDLAILGARPGVGKSAVALQIAQHVTRKTGKVVAFYSLEMSIQQLCQRMLAANSGVLLRDIQNHKAPANESSNLCKIAEAIQKMFKILINENGDTTVTDIRRDCQKIKNLGLIVIDYIQLMNTTERFYNRNDAVGSISRGLKVLAKDLDVPILALSQLNREKSDNEKPSLSDLRESGSLEQDATAVIALWNNEEEGYINATILKNRHGRAGNSAVLHFEKSIMQVKQSAKPYIEPEKKKRRIRAQEDTDEDQIQF